MKKSSLTTMKKIFMALGIALIYMLAFKSAGACIRKIMPDQNTMLPFLLREAAGTVIALVLLIVFRKTHLLKCRRGSFKEGFGAGAFDIVLNAFSALLTMLTFFGHKLNSLPEILFFLAGVLLIGVSEELVFRGTVFDFVHDAFGSSTHAGAVRTALVSGCIFGVMHLFNLTGSEKPAAVFCQAAAVCGVGIFMGAVYLRCRNLWIMMLMHAFSDFVPLLKTGFLAEGTITNAIDSHDLRTIMLGAVYALVGLYLLRPEKMHYTEPDHGAEQQDLTAHHSA